VLGFKAILDGCVDNATNWTFCEAYARNTWTATTLGRQGWLLFFMVHRACGALCEQLMGLDV